MVEFVLRFRLDHGHTLPHVRELRCSEHSPDLHCAVQISSGDVQQLPNRIDTKYGKIRKFLSLSLMIDH